jgi:hypothetical protein
MANYYALIAHHDQVNRDNFYLTKQLPRRTLSIGWGKVNPIGSLPRKIKDDIKHFYPDAEGTNNPWNGEESLPVFCSLNVGDLIFVRGSAKILDIAIITGPAYYRYGSGHGEDGYDYCTMIPFTPLLDNAQSEILTRHIQDSNYTNILEERGRRLVMRKIQENDARDLMKSIFALL